MAKSRSKDSKLSRKYLDSARKRYFDILGAFAIGLALLPLLSCLTVFIGLTNGRVFFSHKRVGRYGRQFYCLKFRTMVPDAEARLEEILHNSPQLEFEWRETQKLKNDPRVTRVGNILRRTSIDEFPQLINVIKGEMSLVGPRPIVEDELERYGRSARYYKACKPGLTGIWQAFGRSDASYKERVAMDRLYFRRASFIFDLAIILNTVRSVVLGRGAY
ncbi:MAG: exopolysaccharide biosynthesis protein [Gimesia sp.]|mgnify:CR=1 FL=1|nr:exopolysaccharide biosynthesis protein [Gimesia sp.]